MTAAGLPGGRRPTLKPSDESGDMMLDAMYYPLGSGRARHGLPLKEFQVSLILPWRSGFGSIHHGDARRSNGVTHTVPRRYDHYDQARHTVPCGHDPHKCFGLVFDRLHDDASYRATAAAPKLATPSCRRFPGGFTTFSSFEWETLSLVKEGSRWLGVFNVIGSVLFGYAAVWLGSIIAGKR